MTRRCDGGSPTTTLQAAAERLAGHRYLIRQVSPWHARLAFRGSVFAVSVSGLDHTLEITASGDGLEFVFRSGWALGLDTCDERAFAARVDDAMSSALFAHAESA